jgi:hypothetical protein
MGRSLIYRNIHVYRFLMNVLYFGRYKKRLIPIIEQLRDLPPDSKILELCFGDIYLAEYCKKSGLKWIGFDLNDRFVAYASKAGYDARKADLIEIPALPNADVCIMMGSFYHFHQRANIILRKMLASAPLVILSEPVKNLSSSKSLLGFFAQRAANTGKGNEKFRYTASSLLATIQENRHTLGYRVIRKVDFGKDLILTIAKNGTSTV